MMSTERAWKLHTTSHVLSMQLFHPAVAKPAVSSADPAGEGTGLLLQVFLPYRGSHATEDLHRVNLEAILLFKRIKMKLKILLCYGIHENIFSQFLACLCIFYNVSDLQEMLTFMQSNKSGFSQSFFALRFACFVLMFGFNFQFNFCNLTPESVCSLLWSGGEMRTKLFVCLFVSDGNRKPVAYLLTLF